MKEREEPGEREALEELASIVATPGPRGAPVAAHQSPAAACGNCGRRMGKLETRHVFRQQVVCAACAALLAGEGMPAGPRTGVTCPSCGGGIAAGAISCPHCGRLAVIGGRGGGLFCPRCRSQNVSTHFNILYIIGAVMFFPIGLLLLALPKRARCNVCSHGFEAPGMKLA